MTTRNHSKTLMNLFRFHRYLSTSSSSTQSQKLINRKNSGFFINSSSSGTRKFDVRIKNQYQVVKSPPHELHNKYFWLKRQRMCGVQFERVSPHITP
ncbi:hypothetical protein MKW92_020959 [Papaver armeniacum]|nr:hypothetical protein MKW92_020959 [Papaver armeniacum]